MVNLRFLKKAYSLAELLMILAIIGVVLMLMLSLVKPNDVVLKLQYYKAYNALAVAAYNLNEHNVENNVKMFENTVLCERLKDYINVTGNYSCNSSYIPLDGKSFPAESIQFVASNGVVFYLSEAFTLEDFGNPQRHRIVWVDINGKRKPNTSVWTHNRPADIVAFDITDDGEVIPLGYPKVDTRYMQAKVVYGEDSNTGSVYTYQKAQNIAFAGTAYEYDVTSYNFDQTNELFGSSVLRIDADTLSKENASQAEACANEEGEDFPQCTIEITQ